MVLEKLLFYTIFTICLTFLLAYLYRWNKNFFWVSIIGILFRLFVVTFYLNTKLNFDYVGIGEFLLWIEHWEEELKIRSALEIITNIYGTDVAFGSIGSYAHFTLFGGLILDIFGSDDFVFPLLLVHIFLSIFTIIPLKKTYDLITNTNVKLSFLNSFFLFNWPNWLSSSTNVGRTIPSVLVVILFFYFITRFFKYNKITDLILTIISIHLIFAFRNSYVFFVISFFSFTYFFYLKNKETSLKWLGYITFFIVLFSFIILKSDIIINKLLFEAVEAKLDGQVEYGSSYLLDLYPTPANFPYFFVMQGIYFLFAPFIWDVRSPLQLAVSIQSMIYMVYFFKLIKGLFQDNYPPKVRILVYSLLLSSFTLGMGVKNAAAADRWRLPITMNLICASMILNSKSYKNQLANKYEDS